MLEETDKIMKAQASRGPTLKRETYLNGQRVSYCTGSVVCKRIQKGRRSRNGNGSPLLQRRRGKDEDETDETVKG